MLLRIIDAVPGDRRLDELLLGDLNATDAALGILNLDQLVSVAQSGPLAGRSTLPLFAISQRRAAYHHLLRLTALNEAVVVQVAAAAVGLLPS